MSDNFENYTFYFKIAYTERKCYYTFSSNTTIKNFIEKIKCNARNDFQIENYQIIEVVEAGNFNNLNGIAAELAPALEPSENTLFEIYGNNWKCKAFYLRILRVN